ncbi:zinc-dependent alcohol dehydrogenase [Prauserella muralis]|uniref:zinc-dependent alcohol dehydrogenase n=1 Tax=Prauserella muralis TaxID=588067 RepID=UPI000DD2CCF2|nr:zinc-binding dehydrogenase [Prauserella muralis]TWE22327.1 threonine dehydrogenase-like Zn-dependent dehydrogenase [Prauserella muralis]
MVTPPATAALASVALGDGHAEVRELPLTACAEDAGWLRVDASGICGTDVALFSGKLAGPCVLGHHVLGQVAALGELAASRWDLAQGDWVVVEEYLPCGQCAPCRRGRYRLCPDTDLWRGGRRVGLVPVSEPPGLYGGNAEYLYLSPNSVPHKVPEGLAAELAVWALPLGNALDWVLGAGRLEAGETVVVFGPGYHGIAAAAAARHAGARQVIVCGLERDQARLELAAALGATPLTLSGDHLVSAIGDLTGGSMADVVLDLAASPPETFTDAARLLGQGGRLVLAGAKSPPAASVDTSALTRLTATVVGVRGRAPQRVRQSLELLRGGGLGLEKVPTETVALSAVGTMLDRMAAGTGPDTPHVVVRPWQDRPARERS